MNQLPRTLYLELLKRTLAFQLWSEPPVAIETFNYLRPQPLRSILHWISRLLAAHSLGLVKYRDFDAQARYEGRVWPIYAHTMIGMTRLNNLQDCVEAVLQDEVTGDLIETGVWRGGACILMRGILAAYQVTDRRVFVADSFAGLPVPDPRWPADQGDRHYTQDYLVVSQAQVEANFRKYDLLDEQVVFLPGWFKDTLPTAPIDTISVLRLDGDMYGSTIEALEHLYPKLSLGGFCIIDDYALPGCRQAVQDYRAAHSIRDELRAVDTVAAFWRRS